jgi:hypothetical protein
MNGKRGLSSLTTKNPENTKIFFFAVFARFVVKTMLAGLVWAYRGGQENHT